MSVDEKLIQLGLELPAAPKAVAVYRPSLVVGNLCFTSGHLPVNVDGSLHLGCLGNNANEQAGYAAAKQAGLAILATLKAELGSLDRVSRIVKLFGMVSSTPEFTQQPAVINGCSELMRDVFGDDCGVGTRSAVGVSSLPLGVMVEIEAIVEIKPE
jgi:enamine deaminase RidA (YjgF/YER057c/UK114 family)